MAHCDAVWGGRQPPHLIARNQNVVARARRQAADLAHALKTPSAILRNELSDLDDQGHDVARAREALSRIDAQIVRSLARMRANSGFSQSAQTDLTAAIDRFTRLFTTLAGRDGKTLEVAGAAGLKVRMDPADVDEVLGNLLDNALKWCRHTIRLTASGSDTHIRIVVEDDGPGIPEESRSTVLDSGRRLDISKPGTGLGLAIVSDLVEGYGGELTLTRSVVLGGLSVTVTAPIRRISP